VKNDAGGQWEAMLTTAPIGAIQSVAAYYDIVEQADVVFVTGKDIIHLLCNMNVYCTSQVSLHLSFRTFF